MKTVYLVRHGKTDGNKLKIFQSPEAELSTEGIAGAQAVAERCVGLNAEALLSSSMKRALQTAEQIKTVTGLDIEASDLFCERTMASSMVGKQKESEEGEVYMAEYNKNFTDPGWRYEDTENFHDISKRIEGAVEMIENHPKDILVIVSHSTFLRHLASYLLHQKAGSVEGRMLTFESMRNMHNVGLSEFTYDGGRWTLITWNDRAHFAD